MARAIRKEQNDQMDRFGDLFRFTMFRTLSAESLTSVAEILRKENLVVGADENFTSGEIILLAEGEGNIVRGGEVIGRVKAGQSYNLEAMFSADDSDTIEALIFRPATMGRIYFADRQHFLYSALSSPQLSAALLKELCEQLSAQTSELIELRRRDSNTDRVVGRIEALTQALLGEGTRSKSGVTQLKYKLEGDISGLITGAVQSKIRQFYIASETADEDRIRIVNDSEFYRTTRFISADGKRTEFERIISRGEAAELAIHRIGSEIYKTRYDVDPARVDGRGIKKLSIDVFDAPAEYKELKLLEADVIEQPNAGAGLESFVGGLTFEDVSQNEGFSNHKIAGS